ncbi:TMEM14 family protein [Phormidesmis sp. 146-12]
MDLLLPLLGIWSILGYGILVAIGGIIGYVNSRSKVSLISGLASGGVLAIACYLCWRDLLLGFGLASLVALLLLGVFAVRFSKTRTFMPAGLMAILSFLATVGYGLPTLSMLSSRRF